MRGTAYFYIAGGIVLVAVLIFFIFLRQEPAVTNYPSNGTTIVAFGDSLVYGTGASSGKDFVSLLSQRIGEPIVNLGTPGDTSALALARVGELNKYKPKVVIILLGGNDYLRDTPPQETFANLSKIIEAAHAQGAVVLLLGVRGGILTDPFKAEFKALSKKYNTAYVSDVLDGLIGQSKYMADRIHPNDAGHARIAERIYPVLEKLVK